MVFSRLFALINNQYLCHKIFTMNEYKISYLLLFNTITDTIENLENTIEKFNPQDTIFKALQKEIKTLKFAQINAEELFISNSN